MQRHVSCSYPVLTSNGLKGAFTQRTAPDDTVRCVNAPLIQTAAVEDTLVSFHPRAFSSDPLILTVVVVYR